MRTPSSRPARLTERLRRNRAQIEADLTDPAERRLLTPLLWGLYGALEPAVRRHARGRLLDAGCGAMPYRPLVAPHVDAYVGFDRERRTDGVEYVGDIEDLEPVPSGSVSTVLCSEVLEHVPHPDRAVRAIARVLEPGGTLILTTPFLARLHEEPWDYFRYTEHALRRLVEEAGLEVVEMTQTGSVTSFLGHQVASLVVVPFWHVPRVGRAVLTASSWLVTRPCAWLDRHLPGRRLLPLGYVTVARRPAEAAAAA